MSSRLIQELYLDEKEVYLFQNEKRQRNIHYLKRDEVKRVVKFF